MRPFLAVAVLTLLLATRVCAAPELFGIDPETAPAGTKLTFKGKGLAKTRHVLFAVGRTVKPAQFRIVSDSELEVIAPDYFRPQAQATVAIFGSDGVTVAMPATAQVVKSPVVGRNAQEAGTSFFHVLDGGIVSLANSVAVIEAGGIVQRSQAAAMHFVKRGGVLEEFDERTGVVFHERGAMLGPALFRPEVGLTFYNVPTISVSPGVGPFLYQPAPRPELEDAPHQPPEIRSFSPRSAAAGDAIMLEGRGFARTVEVTFYGPTGQTQNVGFQVVSDTKLKVEVPELNRSLRASTQLIIVNTIDGLTFTAPREFVARWGKGLENYHASSSSGNYPLLWIDSGVTFAPRGGHVLYIAPGGTVSPTAPGVYFVKKGGRMAANASGGVQVYYETDAEVPDTIRRGNGRGHEVNAIVPSVIGAPFVVVAGPVFRR